MGYYYELGGGGDEAGKYLVGGVLSTGAGLREYLYGYEKRT